MLKENLVCPCLWLVLCNRSPGRKWPRISIQVLAARSEDQEQDFLWAPASSWNRRRPGSQSGLCSLELSNDLWFWEWDVRGAWKQRQTESGILCLLLWGMIGAEDGRCGIQVGYSTSPTQGGERRKGFDRGRGKEEVTMTSLWRVRRGVPWLCETVCTQQGTPDQSCGRKASQKTPKVEFSLSFISPPFLSAMKLRKVGRLCREVWKSCQQVWYYPACHTASIKCCSHFGKVWSSRR